MQYVEEMRHAANHFLGGAGQLYIDLKVAGSTVMWGQLYGVWIGVVDQGLFCHDQVS